MSSSVEWGKYEGRAAQDVPACVYIQKLSSYQSALLSSSRASFSTFSAFVSVHFLTACWSWSWSSSSMNRTKVGA